VVLLLDILRDLNSEIENDGAQVFQRISGKILDLDINSFIAASRSRLRFLFGQSVQANAQLFLILSQSFSLWMIGQGEHRSRSKLSGMQEPIEASPVVFERRRLTNEGSKILTNSLN
jgi:hypothetical protein